MIELASEKIISLAQAARSLPSGDNTTVCPETVWRWVMRGCRDLHGDIVKLEALRIGGRWVTSQEALQRFTEALARTDETPAANTRTPAKRRTASERAVKRLEKAGV